jgi:hypothetical protein
MQRRALHMKTCVRVVLVSNINLLYKDYCATFIVISYVVDSDV